MTALIAALIFLLSVSSGCSQAQAVLNPGFTFTQPSLDPVVSGLPEEIRTRVLASPRPFLDLMAKALDGEQELLRLVDKKTPLSAKSVPPDLVALEAYPLTLTRKGLELRRVLIPDLLDMASAALKEGARLPLSSTYRSFEYQGIVYAREVEAYGRETADRESARPGFSQHQLGTAIDFGSIDLTFADTAEGRWLFQNAWKFGFSQSYPKGGEQETGYTYEPWHYRYVGRPAAALIHDYFGDRQQVFLAFYAQKSAAFRKARVT